MDYYNILGVPRNATPDQIKKAYRQKAKQFHPDRPDGDSEMFKRVNEAYEILSNSDKRSAYDNPHPEFHFNTQHMNRGNPFGRSPFDDIFTNFNRRQPKNRDITIRADIYLEDVMTGKDLIIGYRMFNGEEATVTITVPPGARDGDQIKYEGLGDNADRRFPRGDLFVHIHVKNNPIWQRDNNNLICRKRVNVFDLLLGCVIIIKTLEGKQVKLNIPKGTKITSTFSIPEHGLPDLNTRKRGNLYVKIDPEVPTINDDSLLKEIESIRNKIYTKD
jgi:curved DNA-binding protein